MSCNADDIRFLLDPDRGGPFVFSSASDKTGLVIDIGSAKEQLVWSKKVTDLQTYTSRHQLLDMGRILTLID